MISKVGFNNCFVKLNAVSDYSFYLRHASKREDPEHSIRGCGILTTFFCLFISNQRRAVRTSIEKKLDPMGPIASQGRSVPVVLKKPIATNDF